MRIPQSVPVMARVATTCMLVSGSNSASDTTSPPSLISQVHFHTSWQEQSLFWHCCPPFSRDSFRHKTGKENHPQSNRAVAPRTTRCPSATNCLLPLIHSLLPCHEQNYKAFHQYQPHPSLKSALTSSRSWQTTANHWVPESVPASPLASPPRDTVTGRWPCWQRGTSPISPKDKASRTEQEHRLFQKQKIRGHTWWCCEGHHPIVGKSTSFKLHPLFPSLHFHFPLLKKKRRELQLKGPRVSRNKIRLEPWKIVLADIPKCVMVPAICNSARTGTDPEGKQGFVPWATLVFGAL